MYQVPTGGRFNSELLLVGGVVMQYIATRLSIGLLSRADGFGSGLQALAQWLPIFATGIAATGMKEPGMALALVFGSSVASLSLVMGMTLYVAPIARLSPDRRIWPMVLPVAILLLLAGFRAHLTWYHAVMLLVMGAAILPVWLEKSPEEPAAPPRDLLPPYFVPLLIAVLVLTGFGAWLVLRGSVLTSNRTLTPELLATIILSPLLLLPAVGSGTMLSQDGHADRVVTTVCGTVLLNLCLLLPMVILLQFARGVAGHGPRTLPFPLITWRVDAVVLVVLSFALVPVAAGRWLPVRAEAILLVLLYAAYLAAETVFSVKLLG